MGLKCGSLRQLLQLLLERLRNNRRSLQLCSELSRLHTNQSCCVPLHWMHDEAEAERSCEKSARKVREVREVREVHGTAITATKAHEPYNDCHGLTKVRSVPPRCSPDSPGSLAILAQL